MRIHWSNNFIRQIKSNTKHNKQLLKQIENVLEILETDPFTPSLNTFSFSEHTKKFIKYIH